MSEVLELDRTFASIETESTIASLGKTAFESIRQTIEPDDGVLSVENNDGGWPTPQPDNPNPGPLPSPPGPGPYPQPPIPGR